MCFVWRYSSRIITDAGKIIAIPICNKKQTIAKNKLSTNRLQYVLSISYKGGS